MNPTGNTILITGGGSGIGRGLAEAFHKQGNQVIIAGRRQSVLDETTAANPGMKSLTLDIEHPAAIQSFAAKVVAEFPSLNVLINNAGIMRTEDWTAENIDLSAVESIITTNLLGPLRLTAALLPTLRKQPRATIATVSSGLAFLPLAITPTYCATKAAIHSFTQSLRYQLRDTNIEVLEIVPPYVQTELLGTHQAADPRAMPLADYIAETVRLMDNPPASGEILVERVLTLRWAEKNGNFDQIFDHMNGSFHEELASSRP
ncbi:MAG TPA: SDR family oxidoreductase [Acidobacteriaceae bacterium]|jgi:uncharacterized oxidoreductase